MSANVENGGASVMASGTVSARPVARLDGQRILIVEDNQFVARQCQRALTDAGCEVVDVVTSADEAVRVALERRPQLVLMDIYLPGKRDGVDAAIEIFERCGIRSIFASAPADAVVKARAEIARPLAWLPKPFSDRKLLATVESAIVNAEAYPSVLLKSAPARLTSTFRRPASSASFSLVWKSALSLSLSHDFFIRATSTW